MDNVYAIYDIKGQCYEQPFCFPHDSAALRLLDQIVLQASSHIAKYPEDFSLYCLGTFDPVSGSFGCESPRLIISVADRICLVQASAERMKKRLEFTKKELEELENEGE